jgi:hypothetical protein
MAVRPTGVLVVLGLFLSLPVAALAHGGGTPRLTAEPAGPYRLYAWSEPDPWRVGEAHLSIAVTQPGSGDGPPSIARAETPVADAELVVAFIPLAAPQDSVEVRATQQVLLNDFYYEADTDLSVPGPWRVTIAATGAEGTGSAAFELDVLPKRTLNWFLIGTAAAALALLLGLIVVWSRMRQPARPAPRPTRRANRSTAAQPVVKLADTDNRTH